MDDRTFVSRLNQRALADQDWQICGSGDMNGDGRGDIVWRNTATGNNGCWYLNGNAVLQIVNVRKLADLNWTMVN